MKPAPDPKAATRPAAPPLPRTAVDPGAAGTEPRGDPTPPIASRDLFRGATEVRIDHDGIVYRLRRTALGKLILTK